jgi:hypothetical protein
MSLSWGNLDLEQVEGELRGLYVECLEKEDFESMAQHDVVRLLRDSLLDKEDREAKEEEGVSAPLILVKIFLLMLQNQAALCARGGPGQAEDALEGYLSAVEVASSIDCVDGGMWVDVGRAALLCERLPLARHAAEQALGEGQRGLPTLSGSAAANLLVQVLCLSGDFTALKVFLERCRRAGFHSAMTRYGAFVLTGGQEEEKVVAVPVKRRRLGNRSVPTRVDLPANTSTSANSALSAAHEAFLDAQKRSVAASSPSCSAEVSVGWVLAANTIHTTERGVIAHFLDFWAFVIDIVTMKQTARTVGAVTNMLQPIVLRTVEPPKERGTSSPSLVESKSASSTSASTSVPSPDLSPDLSSLKITDKLLAMSCTDTFESIKRVFAAPRDRRECNLEDLVQWQSQFYAHAEASCTQGAIGLAASVLSWMREESVLRPAFAERCFDGKAWLRLFRATPQFERIDAKSVGDLQMAWTYLFAAEVTCDLYAQRLRTSEQGSSSLVRTLRRHLSFVDATLRYCQAEAEGAAGWMAARFFWVSGKLHMCLENSCKSSEFYEACRRSLEEHEHGTGHLVLGHCTSDRTLSGQTVQDKLDLLQEMARVDQMSTSDDVDALEVVQRLRGALTSNVFYSLPLDTRSRCAIMLRNLASDDTCVMSWIAVRKLQSSVLAIFDFERDGSIKRVKRLLTSSFNTRAIKPLVEQLAYRLFVALYDDAREDSDDLAPERKRMYFAARNVLCAIAVFAKASDDKKSGKLRHLKSLCHIGCVLTRASHKARDLHDTMHMFDALHAALGRAKACREPAIRVYLGSITQYLHQAVLPKLSLDTDADAFPILNTLAHYYQCMHGILSGQTKHFLQVKCHHKLLGGLTCLDNRYLCEQLFTFIHLYHQVHRGVCVCSVYW